MPAVLAEPPLPRASAPPAAWWALRAGIVVAVMVAVGVAPGGLEERARAAEAVEDPPLVVDGADADGSVSLEPGVQHVADGPAAWVLANGGEDALTFTLHVAEVEVGGDGALQVGEELADRSVGADEVHLAPGEAARLRLHPDPDAGTEVLAVVAVTVDADPPTRLWAVAQLGPPVGVTATFAEADGSDGATTVRIDSDQPTLVSLAARVTVWPGLVRDEVVRDAVYVPAGGREIDLHLGGAALGRVTVEVAVSGTDGPVSTTTWWWPLWLVATLATLLLALTAGLVLRAYRRRP